MEAFTRVVCFLVCGGLMAAMLPVSTWAQSSDENPRAGRLGGSAEQLESIYGEADDSSADVIVYEPLEEAGADVEFGIYKKKVFEIIVTSIDGDDLSAQGVSSIVDLLAPADGECDLRYVDNDIADNVYQCHSESLEKAYAEATLNDLGFSGKPGDYHYWSDDDAVVISVGHDEYKGPEPTPIPPTPTPTLEEQLASYTELPDVREVVIRPAGLVGQKFFFYGTLLSISVAPPGRAYNLGDDDSFQSQAQMQVTVAAPDGTTHVVFVGYDGDTTGMFEGSYVVVYGEVAGTQTFMNGLGGVVSQPLVKAILVSL